MSEQAPIKVVNNFQQNNRPYEIVATLLACGALGMIAYALAKNGWLEIAATALTIFLVTLGKMLIANGLLVLPKGSAAKKDFQQTAGTIRTAVEEFRTWQARSPIWRVAAMAAAYTVMFMVARWMVASALGIFTNVWIAGAAAAAIAALIIAPGMILTVVRSTAGGLKGRRVEETETRIEKDPDA